MLPMRAYSIVLFSLLSVATSAIAADITGKPKVIDGDTIELGGQRVRLHGIDAPEAKQICHTGKKNRPFPCGQFATRTLSDLVRGKTVTCKGDERDRYGRLIAVCYIDRVDINEQMVSRGWALAYRRYSQDYVRAEQSAQHMKDGLWKHKFVPPWDWRRRKR